MNYAYAKLSHWDFGLVRFLGPGLGNLLFPWARAIISAREFGLVPIWPTWPQLKIGTVLRRESDARFYSDLFRNPGDYVQGPKKLWLLGCHNTRSEYTLRVENEGSLEGRAKVFEFSGMDGLFSPLLRKRSMVQKELLRIARPEHLLGLSHDFQGSITIHYRLGDFSPFDDISMRAGQHNIRLPLSWVRETIESIRRELGASMPVWLFSDGKDSELQDILSMPGVRRIHFGSGLADMLAMSRSNLLVVSSTFSMWSAFLGAVPSIYYPGQLRQRLLPDQVSYETEREPGAPASPTIFDAIKQRRSMLRRTT